ncbi:unnamed protein product [Wuchereria bancrofti]|uniref:Protein kinase domain-containing protein n=1 Tax=Wuchereria bancrofti TaxID=6293 RepID=A0A3P7GLL6_WUCBA|nr:unnamed protein product [Wuchereria bancrofti]
MAKMDPEERIDVNEAIQHPYFKEYYPSVINEQACPFKVKMDMAAIETLSHEGLVQALINDVRGADEADFTTHSADVALTPGDSSSGNLESSCHGGNLKFNMQDIYIYIQNPEIKNVKAIIV